MMDSGVQFVMTDGNWLKHKWCVVSWVFLEQYQLRLEDNMVKVQTPQQNLFVIHCDKNNCHIFLIQIQFVCLFVCCWGGGGGL